MTPLSPREMADRVIRYLESDKGKVAMQEAERRIAETEELFAEARRIDWLKLHEPFTI